MELFQVFILIVSIITMTQGNQKGNDTENGNFTGSSQNVTGNLKPLSGLHRKFWTQKQLKELKKLTGTDNIRSLVLHKGRILEFWCTN